MAEEDGNIVGAVWVRNISAFGFVGENIPEFAISIYPEYRNQGIGTQLMESMLLLLKKEGYENASLAVQKKNYASKMYLKIGFEIFDENDQEYIMIYRLNK
ncbi:MAG: N-acetyltransferase family protein [Mediterraneibacter gnavus]